MSNFYIHWDFNQFTPSGRRVHMKSSTSIDDIETLEFALNVVNKMNKVYGEGSHWIEDENGYLYGVHKNTLYEEVAQWHDKNARMCEEVSKDDPRLNEDDRKRARAAASHHAASSTAIRNNFMRNSK